jgi:hypothetical protein
MSHVYIIGDGRKQKYFRIGSYTGTEKSLVKEFTSTVPHVCVKLYYETVNSSRIEKEMKNKYKSMRASNTSEWIVGARLDDLTRDIIEMDKSL